MVPFIGIDRELKRRNCGIGARDRGKRGGTTFFWPVATILQNIKQCEPLARITLPPTAKTKLNPIRNMQRSRVALLISGG